MWPGRVSATHPSFALYPKIHLHLGVWPTARVLIQMGKLEKTENHASCFKNLLKYLLCMYVYIVYVCLATHTMCTWRSELNLRRRLSLLPPCGSQGPNPGCQGSQIHLTLVALTARLLLFRNEGSSGVQAQLPGATYCPGSVTWPPLTAR